VLTKNQPIRTILNGSLLFGAGSHFRLELLGHQLTFLVNLESDTKTMLNNVLASKLTTREIDSCLRNKQEGIGFR
jgi:hypothetical protein